MASSSAVIDGGGEGFSENNAVHSKEMTLDDVMRAPSTHTPDVVVLDTTHEDETPKDTLNLREDLWLSSADG